MFVRSSRENMESVPASQSSLMDAPMSMKDAILVNNLLKYVEEDENLSMLPDQFKELAVQTMFNEAKLLEKNIDVDTSNKRIRSNDDDLEMEEK